MKSPSSGWLALGLCCACIAGTARAEVYRWTDAEGHVHFADRVEGQAPGKVDAVALPTTAPATDPELQQQRERGKKLL